MISSTKVFQEAGKAIPVTRLSNLTRPHRADASAMVAQTLVVKYLYVVTARSPADKHCNAGHYTDTEKVERDKILMLME